MLRHTPKGWHERWRSWSLRNEAESRGTGIMRICSIPTQSRWRNLSISIRSIQGMSLGQSGHQRLRRRDVHIHRSTLSLSQYWIIGSRIRCPWVRHTRVANPHNFTSAQRWISQPCRRLRVIADHCWCLNNVLSRNGDAMRRAIAADHSSTLSAMMLPKEESEVGLANGTLADIGVWLPDRWCSICPSLPASKAVTACMPHRARVWP